MRNPRIHQSKRLLSCVTAGCLAVLIATPGMALAIQKKISDENICDAVEDAFFFDKAVPFDRIDATCADGVVSLTGKTNNMLARHRATRLAETIKGVRSVINRIKVKPVGDTSAADLKRDVEAALLSDPAADSYELTVEVQDKGHVLLSGTVESWQEKQLSEQVAMGVKGVTRITNKIDVDYESDRPDQEIQAEVAEALEWNALVDHELIDVKVNDNEVILRGTVGSAAERRQARYDAWVAGVTDVDVSGLKIRDWAKAEERRKKSYVSKSPAEIRAAIDDANLYDPRVKSFNVSADVTGSVVTLRGTVDNLKAKRAASENARNTVGVARVENRLKVRPGLARSDEQVESQVGDALLRDPYVDRYDITVDAVDGTVYLSGTVDSYFEKAEAEDRAARVNGVVDVSNALTVAEDNKPMIYNPYVYDWYVYDYGWYDYEPTYTTRSDDEIEEDVESELWWSPFVDSDEVYVEVEDGVATLTGTVDTWAERRSATENAFEGGAISVHNNLSVVVQ